MKTKNLTQTEREKLVFLLGAYEDDVFYEFYYFLMDMFLKDKGYSIKEREKIKKIGVFRGWFAKQFEKRDKHLIENMLVYDDDNCDYRFTEGYYNYPFYGIEQFRIYYQSLHQDFTRYDEMPFQFNFKRFVSLKTPQQVAWRHYYKDSFTCESFEFYFHFS